ncbi:Inorganic pyrophosphatase [Zalaria obscura]|uniref:Inorganic pyrophosphatase n=1 Tax=Zalaria obscura TaxID=2024903 RepID=A0ACC3SIS0_9PEZI
MTLRQQHVRHEDDMSSNNFSIVATDQIAREEPLNPIKQDVKHGQARFVHNLFPYKGYIWNYGALPRTWENPSHIYPETNLQGDNDPLDVCEIGETVAYTGQVKQVKVLGVMALLDEGDTDFKIIVIDVHDPLASQVNDIGQVEAEFPGLIAATREWFRFFAFSIIDQTSKAWDRLINGQADAGKIYLYEP